MKLKDYLKGKLAQGDKLTHCPRCKAKLRRADKNGIAQCPKCKHGYWVGNERI